MRKRVKHVWTYWGAVWGQLRPALAAQHRLGVMVELGMAIALKKPTFLFRDDFRRATDSEQYPLNLMLFTGLPEESWQDYHYTPVEEITAPEKALALWAGHSP